MLIEPDEPVLVTGGAGFIGSRVMNHLRERGFRNVRCFTRRAPARPRPGQPSDSRPSGVELVHGNLLSREDCQRAARGARVIYHLAAGTGEKSFADAFLNSVVTTRNLLDAALESGSLRRFVSISSFSVYSNRNHPRRGVLDETCPMRQGSASWADAYTFAKIKQDELIMEYGAKRGLPYVLLRPGAVYGPGKRSITARVGVGTFGVFLHLGGGNRVPLTYVENCADAIVLAGLTEGVDGQVLNVVDDELPTSREFLRAYKRNVKAISSIYLPHAVSLLFCFLWEKYSAFSHGQLPPAFSRGAWHAYWKRTGYTNERLKSLLGWVPRVPTAEGLRRYFEDCRKGEAHA